MTGLRVCAAGLTLSASFKESKQKNILSFFSLVTMLVCLPPECSGLSLVILSVALDSVQPTGQ